MRSRFAAFAMGLGGYLVDTLAAAHPDRALPRDALARELGRAKEKQRFLDLCILHTSEAGDHGEVLFYARIFERGEDRSFAELSSFVKEAGQWRYEAGTLVAGASLPEDVRALDKETFLAIAASAAEGQAAR